MKILVVEEGKLPVVREIDGSLESMQRIVGGLIQAVYPFEEPVALVCNEEGKLLGLPMNRQLKETGDIIHGTFFLCAAPPDGERFASLSDEQIERYTRRFHFPEIFFLLNDDVVFVLTDQ